MRWTRMAPPSEALAGPQPAPDRQTSAARPLTRPGPKHLRQPCVAALTRARGSQNWRAPMLHNEPQNHLGNEGGDSSEAVSGPPAETADSTPTTPVRRTRARKAT